MRRFHLHRDKDDNGSEVVAEGVLFASGKVVLSWPTGQINLYDDMVTMIGNQGHEGTTRVVFVDDPERQPQETISFEDPQ